MRPAGGETFLAKHHRLLFYSFWIFLALIQARFTELQDDEAYYWIYSKFPDWGYFDHPPMIALIIKAGYALIPNELGVRIIPIFLNVFTLVTIEKLIPNKNPFLFYALSLSIAVLQLSGFVAVPDLPLIFFTALFFLRYKRFVEKTTVLNALMLGLAIAFLFYSKYHALLIVIFTLCSNLSLLKKYQAWIAAIFAFILFAPHLWWQYQHDWVSFKYHLFENHVNAYKFKYTTDYILGQILIAGPVAGLVILPAAILYKPKDLLERALKFTTVGIFIFFLLSSLRGNVEANWTAPCLIGLMVLSHRFLSEHPAWKKWLARLLPASMIIVLFGRIIMLADIIPLPIVKWYYHSWKDWPAQLKEKTHGLPIVFNNSYQRASKYWFYTGQTSYSQNWYRERKNNYNYWPIEDSLLGKPVYVLDIFEVNRFPDSIKTPLGYVGFRYNPAHSSFAKVHISTNPERITVKQNENLKLTINASMPELYRSYINTNKTEGLIWIGVFGKHGYIKELNPPVTLIDLLKGPIEINIPHQLPKGKYYLRFTINIPGTIPTHNSDKITMIVN